MQGKPQIPNLNLCAEHIEKSAYKINQKA